MRCYFKGRNPVDKLPLSKRILSVELLESICNNSPSNNPTHTTYQFSNPQTRCTLNIIDTYSNQRQMQLHHSNSPIKKRY